MKKQIIGFIACMMAVSLCGGAGSEETISVIPRPNRVQPGKGVFAVTEETKILVSSGSKSTGEYLHDLLKPATGFALPIEEASTDKAVNNAILLTLENHEKTSGDEGYRLEASPESVTIRANAPAGLFYGVQTLRQLLPAEIESPGVVKGKRWTIPAATISDTPRFNWRGMHLDVSRHFFGIDVVKRFIDRLAQHKLNRLHLHLTDDQGWRIAIDAYPKLAETASKRSETLVGHYRGKEYDGIPHGGIYTKDQVRDIVAYAAARHITIIPEIEMPGHSQAALAAYPELGCTNGPYEVRTTWGISNDVFCVGRDNTMTFLKTVLNEVCELFPGPYIHIGGDECRKTAWKACPDCQARIKKLGLKDEHELQAWFTGDIGKHLADHGKKLVGWDEILEGDFQEKAVVMNWRSPDLAAEAAHKGLEVVMASRGLTYFDKYQGPAKNEPLAIGGMVTLGKVYGFEPVPAKLSGTPEAALILGAQGQLWSEYIPNEEHLEYMAYPRACALAEVLWQPAAAPRDFDEFKERLTVHMKRLILQGVNARPLD